MNDDEKNINNININNNFNEISNVANVDVGSVTVELKSDDKGSGGSGDVIDIVKEMKIVPTDE